MTNDIFFSPRKVYTCTTQMPCSLLLGVCVCVYVKRNCMKQKSTHTHTINQQKEKCMKQEKEKNMHTQHNFPALTQLKVPPQMHTLTHTHSMCNASKSCNESFLAVYATVHRWFYYCWQQQQQYSLSISLAYTSFLFPIVANVAVFLLAIVSTIPNVNGAAHFLLGKIFFVLAS